MGNMKKCALVFFLGLGWSTQIWGKVFTVTKTESISKRADELKEIILDVDNTCERGCRYKVSNLRELRMVERMDENRHFTWMYIDSVKDSSMYYLVEVSSTGEGEYRIHSRFPSAQQLRYLKEKHKLSHRSYFDDIDSTWNLKENFDESGNFLNTTVTYATRAESDSMVINMFASKVRSEMQRTAVELFQNLAQ